MLSGWRVANYNSYCALAAIVRAFRNIAKPRNNDAESKILFYSNGTTLRYLLLVLVFSRWINTASPTYCEIYCDRRCK